MTTRFTRLEFLWTGALLLVGLSNCSKSQPDKTRATAGSAALSAAASPTPNAPTTASPEACLACEQRGVCAEFSEACSKFEGEGRAMCEAVQQCVSASNCADGDKTLTSCYCGSLGTSACIEAPAAGPGAPAGPCADVIRKALGGPELKNSQVLTRYLKVEYPGGAAIARMNCDKLDPACRPLCGF